jgi:hypothetical protein
MAPWISTAMTPPSSTRTAAAEENVSHRNARSQFRKRVNAGAAAAARTEVIWESACTDIDGALVPPLHDSQVRLL